MDEIRKCVEADLEDMFAIVNDAAQAYRGVIPADRWHEPYMPRDEFVHEVADGVVFWGLERAGRLLGIMGIQDRGDVTLIRHAYVRTKWRQQGVGGILLKHLETQTDLPILIGTWADAWWAARFYRKYGYELVTEAEKNRLLVKYWSIPERQVATSVVLGNAGWFARCGPGAR